MIIIYLPKQVVSNIFECVLFKDVIKKYCSWKVTAKALTVKIPGYFGYHLWNFYEMQRNPMYVNERYFEVGCESIDFSPVQ